VDISGIDTVIQPAGRRDLPEPTAGDAFLAGGTWLFSEPQKQTRRLIDLTALDWPSIETTDKGMAIGATCTFADLYACAAAPPLFAQCCRALWGSFKIWNTATVGGNLCLALPASPMAALAVALDGTCTIWRPDGTDRTVAAAEFVTGAGRTCLAQGEILRQLSLPAAALPTSTLLGSKLAELAPMSMLWRYSAMSAMVSDRKLNLGMPLSIRPFDTIAAINSPC